MSHPLTIYHNPRCSKSRAALQILIDAGLEPEVVRYLEQPPTRETVIDLLRLLGLKPAELMRRGEAVFTELNLADPQLDDAALIDALVSYPILIERPIVVAGDRAVIGRPPEKVKALL